MLHQILEFKPGLPSQQFAEQILEALQTSRIVHAIGVDPQSHLHSFWDDVSDALGECLPMSESLVTGEKTGEKWIDIRYDGSITNAYRHSKSAQPLHTDGSYESNTSDTVFFYCVKQAAKGGETVFLDADDLITMLKHEDESLLDDLCTTPVCFSKANDFKRRPIISFDERGPVLTWNYYCIDASESEFAKDLAERFHAFLQVKVMAANKTLPVKLRAGEAVFFQDERVLHGRNAFDASEKDERFLRKTGLKLKQYDRTKRVMVCP